MPLAAGHKLGPYEIVAPLGAGGMGEVYRARDTRLGRDVALKILPADVANDPMRRQRFELEARAVAALNHPNIVAIYDVGEGYIVSELVDGEPLRGGKLGLRKTIDIAAQIASGLAAAHDAGIVHRDLKPDNILLTRDGRPKILDFGLAKLLVARAAAADATVTVHTEAGVVMGTAGYMSPEQVRGVDTDHRSDIFSFGVILHELLTGKRAFQGETSVDTMQAILRQDAAELPDTVPAGVRQIVTHCLEKDPGDRFQSARDLRFALVSMDQSGSQSAIAVAVPPARSTWPLRALAAVAILAAGVAGARLLWPDLPTPLWNGIKLGGPERSLAPRPSPDGHWLAFVTTGNDEVFQVAVMKPESGDIAILSHASDRGYVGEVSWSPDGTKIYYDRVTDVPRGIYSVPVLGGEEQLVVEDAAVPEALPDGSLLVTKLNADRQNQLFRYWPETGRWRAYPIAMSAITNSSARAFPDGRQAAAFGQPIPAASDAAAHLYVVDLESGKLRRLETGRVEHTDFGLAVTRDGKSVLAALSSGNLERIIAVPSSGSGPIRTLLSLTNSVFSLDTGPDGSIYLDQVERPVQLLRFSAQGGRAERIATLPAYESPGAPWFSDENFSILPDGRAVLAQGTGGRMRLMVVEAGKSPVPLVATSEPNSAPVAAAGPGEIAFLIGPEPRRTIAMAALSNGRVTRRIPFDKGAITSLASSSDGKTLYCAAGGNIWSIPVAGGEPRKLRAGDYVAVDPGGAYLLVEVFENPIIRLIQVPLNGGPSREVPRTGSNRPAFMISPNSVARDSRILMPLGTSTWYWPPGVIDPRTGEITRIPVDFTSDIHALGWTPDGKVMALGLGFSAQIWKFQTKMP